MSTSETGTLFLHPDRNLALELVRATEAAAIRPVPIIGKGDKLGRPCPTSVSAESSRPRL